MNQISRHGKKGLACNNVVQHLIDVTFSLPQIVDDVGHSFIMSSDLFRYYVILFPYNS